MLFQGSFKGVLKEVLRVFQGCVKDFPESFMEEEVSRIFQECFTKVSSVFQESFNGV